jgi:hypothetical protein
MYIYDLLINIMAQVLALTNGTLGNWVNVASNATGPLDPNITLTTCGTDVVESIAKLAVSLGDILSTIVQSLFPAIA